MDETIKTEALETVPERAVTEEETRAAAERMRARLLEAKEKAEEILAARLRSLGCTAMGPAYIWIREDLFTVDIHIGEVPLEIAEVGRNLGIDLRLLPERLPGTMRRKAAASGIYNREVYEVIPGTDEKPFVNRHARREYLKKSRVARKKAAKKAYYNAKMGRAHVEETPSVSSVGQGAPGPGVDDGSVLPT